MASERRWETWEETRKRERIEEREKKERIEEEVRRKREAVEAMRRFEEEQRAIGAPMVDFFSELPAELIQCILDFMPVSDGLRCTWVSKRWYEVLRQPAMGGFWRRAAQYAGLPEAYIRENFLSCSSPSELFDKARLYTDHIRTIRPQIKLMRGIHPFESTSKCEYAGNGYFVKSVDYQTLESNETAIGELCPHSRTIHKVDSMVGKYGEVEYASVCNNNVIWQTSEGHWFRYDLGMCRFHRFFPKVFKNEMGDNVGHCLNCFLLLIANVENVMHGYNWVLNFFKVEEKEEEEEVVEKEVEEVEKEVEEVEKEPKVLMAVHKPHIPPGITQFIPRPVKVNIISTDGCKTHRLIIQGGTGACVFDVTHDFEEGSLKISPKPIATLNPFSDSNIAVMVVTTTSRMTLSADQRLLGLVTSIVYPYTSGLRLHLFDVQTLERVSSVRVRWEDGFNDSNIMALSGLYAVIAVGHSNGAVRVIHCKTGRVIAMHRPLTRGLPPVIPMAKLMSVHMQGGYGKECLVDVNGSFNVAVLYRKGVNNIEAVFFDPYPPCEALLDGVNELKESESEIHADDDQSA